MWKLINSWLRESAMVAVTGAVFVGITIILVSLVALLIDVVLLGNCDPKFGCVGTFNIGVGVASLAGGISAASYFPLALIRPLGVHGSFLRRIAPAIISGLILSGLLFTIGRWPGNPTDEELMAIWFTSSLAVSAAALLVFKLTQSGNSREA